MGFGGGGFSIPQNAERPWFFCDLQILHTYLLTFRQQLLKGKRGWQPTLSPPPENLYLLLLPVDHLLKTSMNLPVRLR